MTRPRAKDGAPTGLSDMARAFVGQDAETQPHYAGHRERLRERFLQGGADAMPDYELLD